jgi:Mrp family chromosome partitioning ATPase
MTMTEHSKIPLPGQDPEPKTTPASGGSLIERAVSRFDLNSFAPPPVPRNLAPATPKPAQRHRPAPVPEAIAPEPAPEPTPVVVPEPAVEARVAPVPEASPAASMVTRETVAETPEQVVPSQAELVPQVQATPRAAPAHFAPAHHPVSRDHLREQGLILPEGSVTELLEEFRIVKRQLLLQSAELFRQGGGAAAQRVLICSPHPGEGKTYCAVNLALSIAAEKESEVLLVDADFAKPSVLSALGLPGGPGLMDALADPAVDVADFVLGTDIPGLWVLPAGSATTSDSEYLSSSRTANVLDRLTEGAPHRMVIFDSPPALAASPAAELAQYVGQALVVVRADMTGQGALEDAISLLSGCPNIQLLLNAINFSPSGRRFGSYYGN